MPNNILLIHDNPIDVSRYIDEVFPDHTANFGGHTLVNPETRDKITLLNTRVTLNFDNFLSGQKYDEIKFIGQIGSVYESMLDLAMYMKAKEVPYKIVNMSNIIFGPGGNE